MVAPTYRQALERITASGGLFSGRRTLLLREFEIEERPAENIRSLEDLMRELEERAFLRDFGDAPLDTLEQRDNLVSLQRLVAALGMAYDEVASLEIPSLEVRREDSGRRGQLVLHHNHLQIIQLLKEHFVRYSLLASDARTLLRHLGHKHELYEDVGLTEGLINKLANDTGRHPAAMVEAGVRAFLQNMYDRGLSSQDFNLRQMVSSVVRDDHFFPNSLTRLANALDELGI